MKLQLRPYQSAAVDALRASYKSGHRAPLLALPTGGGKTVIFCAITEGAASRGYEVLILVHRQELLLQGSRALETIGVEHGLIAPGYRPGRDRVQVASVQTVVRRLSRLKFGQNLLIVIDEAHHATAGSWRKVVQTFPDAKVLGVTATPIRTDGQGLGEAAGGIFDDLVVGPSVRELVGLGFLVKPVVYAPPSGLDFRDVRMVAGDFNRAQSAAKVDKPQITGDAVGHYKKLCPGAPALAFCVSLEHAEHVAEQFRAAGYRAARIDGSLDDTTRRRMIRDLGSGALHVLTSCDLIGEGVDIPVVAAAILLRPTASTGLFLQQVGRALRPAPGKSRALVLDHVGNCLRHGMPDDDRQWTLDGVEKKARAGEVAGVAVRTCRQCFAAAPGGTAVCPECGAEFPVEGRQAPEAVAGELEEVSPEQAAAMARQRRQEIGRARSLEDLQRIAQARGYKPAWARVIWNSRQQRRA